MERRNYIKEYLDSGRVNEDLSTEFGIHWHVSDGLVVYKYSQGKSPKENPIVRQARGVVLEEASHELVHYAFYRFFNYGEVVEENRRFNWKNAVATEKVDGVLFGIFNYRGEWRVCTGHEIGGNNSSNRSPFAYGELMEMAVKPMKASEFFNELNPRYDYTFELVSPFNRIVTPYDETRLYLICARDKERDFREIPFREAYETDEIISPKLRDSAILKIPETRSLTDENGNYLGFDEMVAMANRLGQTDEGYVVVDYSSYDPETASFPRIKVKNSSYLAFKYLRSDDVKTVSNEDLLYVAYQSEEDEFLAVLPHYKELLESVRSKWLAFLEEMERRVNSPELSPFFSMSSAERGAHMRDFALAVANSPRRSLLVQMFKTDRDVKGVLKDALDVKGKTQVFKKLWADINRTAE